MKRSYQTIVLLFSISFLFSCGTKEVSYDQLVVRSGVVYEVNSQTPFTGEGMVTHENGQLRETSFYKDGKLGLVLTYHKNGQLKRKVSSHKNGNPEGFLEMYSENGELLYKVCYKNGDETDMSYCEK